VKPLRNVQNWIWLFLTLVSLPMSIIPAAGQGIELPGDLPSELGQKLSDTVPEQPSVPPAFSIPLRPLGYSAPGRFYLGRHNRLVSLDFIGEDRLLFTFQVPGLMQREEDGSPKTDERQIRAVVVALPGGKIESEAQWTLHDRVRYLWMLRDGHFLLRDQDGIQEGDATLQLKPYLHFPGRLLWLQLNPAQQFISVNFLEPPASLKDGKQDSDALKAENVEGASKIVAPPAPPLLKPNLAVRTLNRETGKVMMESSVGLAVPQAVGSDGYTEVEEGMLSGLLQHAQVPIDAVGHVETLHDNVNLWLLNLKQFDGGIKFLNRIASTCEPSSEFTSERVLLVTACNEFGGWDLVALSSLGGRLWGKRISDHEIWPQLASSLDGSRLARETVIIEHPVKGHARLVSPKNLTGQIVRVFDAANGKVALETTASPILDGGGNVAISPSGRRVAVLNNGEIQVFELPAAAAFRGTH
jgi:hypothetical protein